jgi:hypothetical protein
LTLTILAKEGLEPSIGGRRRRRQSQEERILFKMDLDSRDR